MCVFVCVYVCVCARAHVCTHGYYMCTGAGVYVRACVHACEHVCVCVCMRAHEHVCQAMLGTSIQDRARSQAHML